MVTYTVIKGTLSETNTTEAKYPRLFIAEQLSPDSSIPHSLQLLLRVAAISVLVGTLQ